MDIGIIGYGTVGKAVVQAFQDLAQVHVYDPAYINHGSLFEASIEAVSQKSQFTFLCVPTPQSVRPGDLGGPFDGTILDQCIQALAGPMIESRKILVIVSTTLPSRVAKYRKQWPDLRLVVCPEFLAERSASDDFLNPRFRILGGKKEDVAEVQHLFSTFSKCRPCSVGYCDAVGAALIKYMSNAYLALKVSMLNQFFDLWKLSDCETDWAELAEIWHLDSRIGSSHYDVPGPDGDRGWGGKCFPKDVSAMLFEAKDKGVSLSILEEAWNYNKSIRTQVDWLYESELKQKG